MTRFKIWAVAFSAFVACAGAVILMVVTEVSAGASDSRSLKLYHIHTHEKVKIVFWQNGHFMKPGLKRLNHFFRDWRNNKVISMKPELFNVVWHIYKLSGSKSYIHVVSAYRTQDTNKMLRSLSKYSGVAKHSQHILGKAIDMYLPDVALSKLHNIALGLHKGGVGYYPHSAVPFVHIDVGPVRKWSLLQRLIHHHAHKH